MIGRGFGRGIGTAAEHLWGAADALGYANCVDRDNMRSMLVYVLDERADDLKRIAASPQSELDGGPDDGEHHAPIAETS